jgi:hypothetical protein
LTGTPLQILAHIEILLAGSPFLVLLHEQSADQPKHGLPVREYAYDTFPAADFLVQTLDAVRRSQALAVLLWQACFLSSKITQKNRVFLPIIVMGIFYRCFISACFIL